jgi:hypothetical protein
MISILLDGPWNSGYESKNVTSQCSWVSVQKTFVGFRWRSSMRKLTLCCFATTALLALPLSVQAAPAGAMPGVAGLHSTLGGSRVILVAEEQKSGDTAQPTGDTQPTGDKTTDNKDGGAKKTTTPKKKSARRKHSQPSKKQVMQKVKQYQQYVPKEYQGYIQQGAGGAGGAGGGAGGAGGGYGGYTR